MGGRDQPGGNRWDRHRRRHDWYRRRAVRQLLPVPLPDVEVADVYGGPRPAPEGRPWVMANVVASVDGSAVLGGRTAGLSSEADRHLFHLLRSLADVVLVGANTVRVEGYGPARGAGGPPIAVVSRSLELDWDSRLFTEAGAPTMVVTCTAADAARRRRAEAAGEVIVAGEDHVEVDRAVAELGRRGVAVVLCEGGPCLLGEVVAAGHLDELCTTVAPLAVGGAGPRVAMGAAGETPVPLRLVSALEEHDHLFLRYLRG